MSELKEIPKEGTGKDLLVGLIKIIIPWALILLVLSLIL